MSRSKIRLSQCMIVKDEEKNIRKALSWGKSIVDEQIVVDTGSADQTADIAKEMGAKAVSYTHLDVYKRQQQNSVNGKKENLISVAAKINELMQGIESLPDDKLKVLFLSLIHI